MKVDSILVKKFIELWLFFRQTVYAHISLEVQNMQNLGKVFYLFIYLFIYSRY